MWVKEQSLTPREECDGIAFVKTEILRVWWLVGMKCHQVHLFMWRSICLLETQKRMKHICMTDEDKEVLKPKFLNLLTLEFCCIRTEEQHLMQLHNARRCAVRLSTVDTLIAVALPHWKKYLNTTDQEELQSIKPIPSKNIGITPVLLWRQYRSQ